MKIIIVSLLLFSSSLFSCQFPLPERTPPQDPEAQKQWAATVAKYEARHLNIRLPALSAQTRKLVSYAATQELELYSDQLKEYSDQYKDDPLFRVHPRIEALKHTFLDTVNFFLSMDAVITPRCYDAFIQCDKLTYDSENTTQATAFITYLLEEKQCPTLLVLGAFEKRMNRAVSYSNQDHRLLNLYVDNGILSRWDSYSTQEKKILREIVDLAIHYPVPKVPAVVQIIEKLKAHLSHEKTSS